MLFLGCDDKKEIYGCTNQSACNFNPNATIFDDTCTYESELYDCDNVCKTGDYNCNIIGDFEFFITLSQKFKIGSMQEPLATYRVHSSNYSTRNIRTHVDELKSWIEINEKQLKQEGYNINKQKFYLLKLKIKLFLSSFF